MPQSVLSPTLLIFLLFVFLQAGLAEITGAIGAGGMGEVYQAHDTKLGRDVAIKVLPDHLSDRAELRERFEREARTIASLNHPHICTLYDVGHQDGTDYLVMEYFKGETLAQRLLNGPLPLVDFNCVDFAGKAIYSHPLKGSNR